MQENTNKNNLCILIPTYNRSDAVNYYLENKLADFQRSCFDVVIYDSSKNDLTENIVSDYIKNGFNCLKYIRYEDPENDFYGNKKVEDALLECANNYKYVWLCGDNTILLLDGYEVELKRVLENSYDVIHIYMNKMGIGNELDMDYKVFFENFFWSMTHWCSFILSGRIILEMDKWIKKYRSINEMLGVVFAVFAALSENSYKIAYINSEVYKYSPWRTEATAYKKKDILRGYAEVINVGIDNLPSEYTEIKKVAKKSLNKNIGLFSRQGAIDLRADGNLTFKNMLRYSMHLKHVTDVPISWFYLWTLLPKWIARKISSSYIVNVEGTNKLCEFNEQCARLIIYGAGEHGTKIIEKIKYIYNKIEVIAIADKNWDKIDSEYPLISPRDICNCDYDYVGVAIVNSNIYKDIKNVLIKLGVSRKKIFHV